MLSWLFRQLRYFWVLLRTHDSPRQLAAGFACGIVVGLVPKGNLLAVVLATILLSLKLNLAVAMISAACTSFLAGWIDPLTHRIGLQFLERPGLQATWIKLANTPFVPWTRFNNTIVLGSLILGLVVCYPAYRLSLPHFTKMRRKLKKRAVRRARQAKNGKSGLRVIPRFARSPSRNTVGVPEGQAVRPVSDDLLRLRQRRFREFMTEIEHLSQSRTGRAA